MPRVERTYQELATALDRAREENAELLAALGTLIAYSVGNKEPREGNPYLKPSIDGAISIFAKTVGVPHSQRLSLNFK